MLKTISKSFWGVSILLVNPQTFFFPTLVTGFWYLAYTSCDRRSVRLVLCVHLWCIHTLLIPCGDFCVHFLEHVYTSGTFRTLLVHAYTSVYTFGACVHFWYLAYTSGAHGVLTLLWCWQKFRSLLGYQHFAGQHKLFFFPTLVVGTLRTLHVIADVYARYSALAYTSGACVHFWCMRTLLVHVYTSGTLHTLLVCAPHCCGYKFSKYLTEETLSYFCKVVTIPPSFISSHSPFLFRLQNVYNGCYFHSEEQFVISGKNECSRWVELNCFME